MRSGVAGWRCPHLGESPPYPLHRKVDKALGFEIGIGVEAV